jgi:hypothetical protein
MGAEKQFAECQPPRRGAVIALTIDTTARAYDMLALDLSGFTPKNAQKEQSHVVLWMQAETDDVYFYFASGEAGAVATGDVDDVDTTAALAAGASLAYANTYAARLVANNGPLPIRIDRSVDRFLVVRGDAAAILRFWAASSAE